MLNSFEREIDGKNSVIFQKRGSPDILKPGEQKDISFYENFYLQGYDVLIGTRTRQFRIIVTKLSNYLGESAAVLDVGCGNGLFVDVLQEKRPDCVVTGIDPGSNSKTPYLRKSDFFQSPLQKLMG